MPDRDIAVEVAADDKAAPHTVLTDPIARPHPRFIQMRIKWTKINDLLEGVEHMRRQGIKYLPKIEAERAKDYEIRVEETELYPGVTRALDRILGLPFSQPVTLKGELPEILKSFEVDADEDGTDLTLFAKNVMEDAVAYGKTHILTDFPEMIGDDSGEQITLSKAEEDKLNRRPRFVHIPALSLFNWVEGRVNGQKVLTEIRYFNTRYQADPEKDDEIRAVQQVIVLGLKEFIVYENKDDLNNFEEVERGNVTWDRIPLTIIYTAKTGFMTARSPLNALADANLAHWRDTSLHTAAVNGARTTLWFFKGFTAEEVEKNVAMGTRAFVSNQDTESGVEAVEHTGAAIETSRAENDKLELRVDRLGAEPLHQRSSTMVATGVAINEQHASSDLQAWIEATQTGLTEAFVIAFGWVGIAVPMDFAVKIYRDFRIPMTAQDSEHLLNMRRQGELDRETYLEEEKRRGTLDRDRNVATIMEKLESETSMTDRGGDRDTVPSAEDEDVTDDGDN